MSRVLARHRSHIETCLTDKTVRARYDDKDGIYVLRDDIDSECAGNIGNFYLDFEVKIGERLCVEVDASICQFWFKLK